MARYIRGLRSAFDYEETFLNLYCDISGTKKIFPVEGSRAFVPALKPRTSISLCGENGLMTTPGFDPGVATG